MGVINADNRRMKFTRFWLKPFWKKKHLEPQELALPLLQLHFRDRYRSQCYFQGCGSRDLVLVSRPIKTTFLRSWSWSWSRRVVLSKTWGYVQPQRYLCRKSKLASECAPLFTYLLFDRPILMFCALLHLLQCNIQMSMNENCLCVLVVTKTAKVSVSVSACLVLVSDSLVLITSLLNIYEREVFAKCADILCFYSIFQCLLSYFLLEWYFSTDF